MPKQQASNNHPSRREPKGTRMKKVAERDIVDLLSGDPLQKELKMAKQLPASDHATSDICLMCLDQSFQGGKYILDCAHSLCSPCLQYWQGVSNCCPVCNSPSKSVLSLYCGASRLKAVDYSSFLPGCVKCGGSRHYHLMYFCDQCNMNCVHTYCDSTLSEEKRGERWVCEECIYDDYYENRYNQESLSEQHDGDEPEDDSFIVNDHVIQCVSDDEVVDVDSQSSNRNKYKLRGKQEFLKKGNRR